MKKWTKKLRTTGLIAVTLCLYLHQQQGKGGEDFLQVIPSFFDYSLLVQNRVPFKHLGFPVHYHAKFSVQVDNR